MTFRRRPWWGRMLALGAMAATILGAAVAPATGSEASSTPERWTAGHQNGSAEGTVEVLPHGIVQKIVKIEGEATSSAVGECYRVQLWAQHDFAGWFHNITDHCGTGSTPFATEQTGMRATSSFGIRLCRISHEGADGVTSCGQITWVG